jgi:hypothetical protein
MYRGRFRGRRIIEEILYRKSTSPFFASQGLRFRSISVAQWCFDDTHMQAAIRESAALHLSMMTIGDTLTA